MKYYLWIVCFGFLSLSFFGTSQSSEALAELFTEIRQFEKSTDAYYELDQGKVPDRMLTMTWSDYLVKKEKLESFLAALDLFDRGLLNRQEQISQATMRLKLNSEIAAIEYKRVLIPFNAEGGFFNRILFSIPGIKFETKEDYERYLNWLTTYGDYLKANSDLMRLGIEEDVVAPKVIVNNMIAAIDQMVKMKYEEHPLLSPLQHFPEQVSEIDRNELERESRKLYASHVVKPYRELYDFVKNEYKSAAKEKVGISEVTDGRSLYEERVDYYTTLNISPDSVFNLGLNEVQRIKNQMLSIIKELEFEGNYEEFLNFLRTDSRFYPETGEELLYFGAWLSKKAEGQLPKYFKNLYSLPFTIEPVPDEIAPTYTAGRYVGGNEELNKPGIYWVNTHKLKSRTLYTFPALTLHEAVPGHHLQAMRAAQQSDIPDFRKSFYISAYGEGWALYGEYLGEEMGMYKTPYELFGRYTYEMWRACRLVVDVGLHYKGWSRQQAIDYMTENTALSNHEIGTEIDRYIGWPAQALSYKIGELTIKSLREKSEKTLGDKFDIKEFHEVILRNGSIPLTELIHEVDLWLSQEN